VLAADSSGDGPEVLERDQAGQADAHLVLGPAEHLTQLTASEGGELGIDTLGFGPGSGQGLGGSEEAPGLGSEVVAAAMMVS